MIQSRASRNLRRLTRTPICRGQAIHDEKTIAVRLSWRDDEGDRQAVSGSSFEDAVAMELYRGDSEPFVGMGGPGSTIDVWFWDRKRTPETPDVDHRQ